MLKKAKKKLRKCGERTSYALGWTCCSSADSAFSDKGSNSDDDDSDGDESTKFVEIDLLRADLNAQRKFPNNSIRTAKYTLASGLPLSLLYQFHKVSNVYFLLVMIISLVPGASPINPFSSIAPLCVVLGAGIIKDLWEDWKRRKADKAANEKTVHVLRDGGFVPVPSFEVRPGDVMLFRLGEEVKADCLILNTSLPDGLTYIETANLDGETNAKTRRAKIQTVKLLGTVEDIEEVALDHGGHVSSTGASGRAGGGVIQQKIGAASRCGGDAGCRDVAEAEDTERPDGDFLQDIGTAPEKEVSQQQAQSQSQPRGTGGEAADGEGKEVYEGLYSDEGSHENGNGRRNGLPAFVEPAAADTVAGSGRQTQPQQPLHPTFSKEGAMDVSCGDSANREYDHHGADNNGRGSWAGIGGEASGGGGGRWRTREEREAHGHYHHNGGGGGSSSYSHRRSFRAQHNRTRSAGDALPLRGSTRGRGVCRVSNLWEMPVPMTATNAGSGVFHYHSRQPTLDERLERDGVLPVPQEIQNMSRRYEAAAAAAATAAAQQRSHRRHHSIATPLLQSLGVGGGGGSGVAPDRDPLLAASTRHATAMGQTPCPNDGESAQKDVDGPVGLAAADPHAQMAGVERRGVVILGSAPSPDLSSWYGQVRIAATGEMIPCGIDQFLPRGCIVRNTDWVLGAVLYTGKNTKMLLNLRPKPNKSTRMTRRLNQINIFLFILNQVLMFLLCGLAVWFTNKMRKQQPGNRTGWSHWYLQWNLQRYPDAALFWWRYLTNFVLLSFLIPMSLYVTLEFNKAMQMLMIGSDKRMAVFDEFTGKLRKSSPKTSELNCQLGQVGYIFTDKTGTLTENLMTYVGGFVAGLRHDEREKPGGIGKLFYHRVSSGKGGGGGGNVSGVLLPGGGGGANRSTTAGHPSHRSVLSLDDPEDGPRHSSTNNNNNNNNQSGLYNYPSGRFGPGDSGVFLQPAATLHNIVRHAPQNSISVSVNVEASPTYATSKMFPTAAHGGRAAGEPMPVRRLGNFTEAELEDDDMYRYLRAMALCHSVVCFDVNDRDEARVGANNAARKQQRRNKRKHKKQRESRKDRGSHDGHPHDSRQRRCRGHRHPPHDEYPYNGDRREDDGVRREPTEVAVSPAHDAHLHARSASKLEELAARSAELVSLGRSSNRYFHVSNAVPAGPDGEGDASCSVLQHHVVDEDHHRSHCHRSNDDQRHRRRHRHHPHDSANHEKSLHNMSYQETSQLLDNSRMYNVSKMLHGRTGSSSWYVNRYNANATHPRMGSSVTRGVPSGAAAASVGEQMEEDIDRSKIYEGQSLDEIALVSAARENGFTLFQRTAKQLFIKVMGQVLCYDVVAELEFTPQRKLMSILLHRNPLGDSEDAATSAAAGGNTHYHRTAAATNAVEEEKEGDKAEGPQASAAAATAKMECRGDRKDGEAEMQQTARRSAYEPFASTSSPAQEQTAGRGAAADKGMQTAATAAAALPPPPGPLPREAVALVESEKQRLHRGSHDSAEEDGGGGPRSGARPSGTVPPYLLLVKGADSSMMDIVNMRNRHNAAMKSVFLQQLDEMASQGLRTLVLGQKYLSEAEVARWLPVFYEAQCAMHQRSERLHEAYALLECDVDLVGTTAVEDKLQEGVPETLEFMSQAGIVVWMLTGDKRETAVTIALTSGLVSAAYEDYVCHLDIAEEAAAQHAAEAADATTTTADGNTRGAGDASSPNTATNTTTNTFHTNGNGSGSGTREAAQASATPLHAKKCRVLDEQLKAAEDLCAQAEAAAKAHTEGERKDPQGDGSDATALRQEGVAAAGVTGKVTVIVVDGKTLDFIFQDNERAHRFFELGSRCRSAVCCRMTPLQKAQVVHMFQKNMQAVALAIGDGANDVSMIQESKIGVGIMGLEGSQAELASDYAIPKFRFLKRLMMVHGRFSIFRDAHCILYSLYKNVVITVAMISYSFYSAYSGQAFIDSWLLAMFSIFFCSLQPLMIGILDKDVEDELAETLPQLYPPLSAENMYFSFPYIIKWMVDGLVEGACFFFFVIYTCALKEDIYRSKSGGIEDYGMVFFTMLILVVNLRVGVLVTYYMILFAIAILLEIAMLPVIQLVYSEIHNLAGSNWCLYVAHALYSAGKFYMFLLFSVGVLVVYTMSTSLYIQLFAPWQNAGLAMMAAKRSPYRRLYLEEKKKLTQEYRTRVATYLAAGNQQILAEEEEEEEAARRQRRSAHPSAAASSSSKAPRANGPRGQRSQNGCRGREGAKQAVEGEQGIEMAHRPAGFGKGNDSPTSTTDRSRRLRRRSNVRNGYEPASTRTPTSESTVAASLLPREPTV